MSRISRQESATGIYHVIIRGNNKHPLFHTEDDFESFTTLLKSAQNGHEMSIHHYCLMNNHVHLLVRAPILEELSRYMHYLQRAYYHYYRKKYTHWGHLFQGRFRSLVIEDEGYLLECGRYIERNPVRAKIVKNPGEWPYCSYEFYAGVKPMDWLTASAAYLALSENQEDRQRIYRERVSCGRPYEEELDSKLLKP
jgi:putative transposase